MSIARYRERVKRSKVRDTREKLGLSVYYMSHLLDITEEAYAKLEDDPSKTSFRQKQLIAQALGREIDEVFYMPAINTTKYIAEGYKERKRWTMEDIKRKAHVQLGEHVLVKFFHEGMKDTPSIIGCTVVSLHPYFFRVTSDAHPEISICFSYDSIIHHDGIRRAAKA